jgi:hypothetical protein
MVLGQSEPVLYCQWLLHVVLNQSEAWIESLLLSFIFFVPLFIKGQIDFTAVKTKNMKNISNGHVTPLLKIHQNQKLIRQLERPLVGERSPR